MYLSGIGFTRKMLSILDDGRVVRFKTKSLAKYSKSYTITDITDDFRNIHYFSGKDKMIVTGKLLKFGTVYKNMSGDNINREIWNDVSVVYNHNVSACAYLYKYTGCNGDDCKHTHSAVGAYIIYFDREEYNIIDLGEVSEIMYRNQKRPYPKLKCKEDNHILTEFCCDNSTLVICNTGRYSIVAYDIYKRSSQVTNTHKITALSCNPTRDMFVVGTDGYRCYLYNCKRLELLAIFSGTECSGLVVDIKHHHSGLSFFVMYDDKFVRWFNCVGKCIKIFYGKEHPHDVSHPIPKYSSLLTVPHLNRFVMCNSNGAYQYLYNCDKKEEDTTSKYIENHMTQYEKEYEFGVCEAIGIVNTGVSDKNGTFMYECYNDILYRDLGNEFYTYKLSYCKEMLLLMNYMIIDLAEIVVMYMMGNDEHHLMIEYES